MAGDLFGAAAAAAAATINEIDITSTVTDKHVARVQCREEDESGHLEETDLQGVCGSDFHG